MQEFEIERKEIANFFIEYLKTHRFIKNKSVALSFLKKFFPDLYFGNEILNIFKHKMVYFCKLALENVIVCKASYSGRVYHVKDLQKISNLEEKLKNLKNTKIKIKI